MTTRANILRSPVATCPAAVNPVASFAEGGGHVLMTFFSGIVDDCDRIRLGGYPGGWRDLLGIRVTEFWPLAPGSTVTARFADNATFTCSTWQEAAVAPVIDGAPPAVDAVRRTGPGGSYLRLCNTGPRRLSCRRLAPAGISCPGGC
jgi:Beta-galactosidase trimerisation domain